jgi:uncharacterized protein
MESKIHIVAGKIQPPELMPSIFKHTLPAAVLLLTANLAFSQGRGGNPAQLEYVHSNYVKFEYRIPMRDGTKLFTSVYVPKDTSHPYPILLTRTPYGVAPYGTNYVAPRSAQSQDTNGAPAETNRTARGSNGYRSTLGPSDMYTKEGFIFAYQDVRGRNQSEGVFDDPPAHKQRFSGPTDTDESTDSYDTIDWLVKNIPNNNGRVGTYGISYPGFFSAFTLIDSHPALKAASPQAPMADVGNGDDAYHNGAFCLAENFDFYMFFKPKPPGTVETPSRDGRFNMGTPDEYDFFLRMGTLRDAEDKYFKHQNEFWSTMVQHDTYDDFWKARALSPQMHHLTAAVLVVGGWYDAQDLGGTPRLFQAIMKDGSAPAATLVMGPWTHGSWSGGNGDTLDNLRFKENTSLFYRENIEFPFFLEHLKGQGNGLKTEDNPKVPKAWVFATGTNKWYRFDTWPPTNVVRRSLHLEAGGKLSFDPPAGGRERFDEYTSDPAKPVPVTEEIGVNLGGDYMAYDQRFASRRPDVLVYESEPLKEAVTIAGPITPILRVSTSGSDSDFVVKLIDVYPNDYRDPQPQTNGFRRGGGGGAGGAVPMGGFQQLVRGEPFRGKFRNNMTEPSPFVPGRPTKIQFDLPDVMHTFMPGHRIMVQIQSTWFPLVDLNPQKFMDIPSAKASDFQKATERVYCGGPDGTRLDVLVYQ